MFFLFQTDSYMKISEYQIFRHRSYKTIIEPLIYYDKIISQKEKKWNFQFFCEIIEESAEILLK